MYRWSHIIYHHVFHSYKVVFTVLLYVYIYYRRIGNAHSSCLVRFPVPVNRLLYIDDAQMSKCSECLSLSLSILIVAFASLFNCRWPYLINESETHRMN